MKFKHNQAYTTIAIYAFLVLAAAMVFIQAVMNLELLFGWFGRVLGFIQPVIYGLVFAFILNPLLRLFDDRLLTRLPGRLLTPKRRRAVAILLSYLVAGVMLSVFIAIVVPQLIFSITSLGSKVSAYVGTLQGMYTNVNAFIESTYRDAAGGDGLSTLLYTAMEGIGASLKLMMNSATQYATQSLGALVSATTRLTTGLINLALGVVVSAYILFDREKLLAQCNKILVALLPQRRLNLLYDIGADCQRILNGFIVGNIIDSIIVGIVCFIGMSIMHMPYAVLISVIIGVTNLIPYFGPFIGAIPSLLILFIERPSYSLWFLIFIFLLQQFDGNIVAPKILGDTVGLSALWIIFSIMLFSGLFGVLGMFIGVPLFAIIYSLAKRLIAYLLERKGLSASTRDYASERNKLIQ